MSNTITPFVVGNQPIQAHLEFTSREVALEYADSFAIYVELFNLKDEDTDPSINTIANFLNNPVTGQATAEAMEKSLQDLLNLSKGLGRPASGSTPAAGDFLSIEMATALDQLLKSLKVAGVDVDAIITDVNNGAITPQGRISQDQAIAWKDYATTSSVVRDFLQLAIGAAGERNTSLQAMVESVYVRTGNDLIAGTLEGLETALNITKSSLGLLNDIQAFYNNVTPQSKGTFASAVDAKLGAAWTATTAANKDLIATAASEFFGTNIQLTLASAALKKSTNSAGQIVVVPGVVDPAFISRFLDLRDQLDRQIFALSPADITPPLPDGSEDPQSLLAKLKAVRTNFVLLDSSEISTAIAPEVADIQEIADVYTQMLTEANKAVAGLPPYTAVPPSANTTPLRNTFLSFIGVFLTFNAKVDSVIDFVEKNKGLLGGSLQSLTSIQRFTSITDLGNLANNIISNSVTSPSLNDLNQTVQDITHLMDQLQNDVPTFYGFQTLLADGNNVNILNIAGFLPPNTVQGSITTAITAGENLNDTQKEKVRRFMFVFEEYYKSASAILTKITQIIQRMAQGINR